VSVGDEPCYALGTGGGGKKSDKKEDGEEQAEHGLLSLIGRLREGNAKESGPG